MTARPRIVLFGPFDRHNLGDLLFAQVLRALLPKRELSYAGLARRDLRALGGVATQPLSELIRDQAPLHLIHAGGETLSCEAWEAAAMLLPPEDARAAAARYAMAPPDEQQHWAQTQLGIALRAPYVLSKHLFHRPGVFVHNAVGGVALAERDPDFQTEAAASLNSADFVGVRDRLSHATLARLGIEAVLMPDAAVMVQTLFGARIALHAETGEPARVRTACAAGYIAAQFSLDFADAATLRALAAALDQLHLQTGFTIVLFRAGAAPLHDDLAMYRTLAARMHHAPLIFESLQVWDICALIAHSRLFCGSSLHGRIVALAYGLPRVSVQPPTLVPGQTSKIAAMIETWEPDHRATLTEVNGLAHAAQIALSLAPASQQALAASLCAHYQAGFRQWHALLECPLLHEDQTMTGNRLGLETATLGGGCFWCLEAVFEQARGVEKVISGYAAGHTDNPAYEDICDGTTGHAEVVQITFDPQVISYRTLLEIFFTIHDPTTPNRQGNDRGTQYRSIILHHDDNQKAVAHEVMREINDAGIWSTPIVTQLQPLEHFYPGEGYHQGYYRGHESQPYCQFVVAPKVVKFREKFRSLLKANS